MTGRDVSSWNIARMLATWRLLKLEPLALASAKEAQEGWGGRRLGSERSSQCCQAFTNIWSEPEPSPRVLLFSHSLLTGDGWGVLGPGCSPVPCPISSVVMHASWGWILAKEDLGPSLHRSMCPAGHQPPSPGPKGPGLVPPRAAQLPLEGTGNSGNNQIWFFCKEYVLPM